MALEITTVGANVAYCWESTSGTFPSSGTWTVLPDVNEAPEFNLSINTIDASNISDKITRYALGRQDPGGDAAYTLNHTDVVVDAWASLVTTAATKYASGLRLWWAYIFPDADDSYYWCGRPAALGTNGIQQNSLSNIPAHCAVEEVKGWATAPTTVSA